MEYVGLLGKNISYSKSPEIHNKYYYEHGIQLDYKIFDVNCDNISNFVKNLRINKIVGFNVTIPYKTEIIKYLDDIDSSADIIGAVNTVLVTNEKLIGYNTDYYGFIKSLEISGFNVSSKTALIIGNGGSARCIFTALKDLNIKCIHVIARDTLKSKANLHGADIFLNLSDYQDGINLEPYDIVVNCTPIGGPNYIHDKLFNITKVNPDALVYDINYGNKESQLLNQARQKGAQVMNGSLMLKNQAVKAMNIWIDYLSERGK